MLIQKNELLEELTALYAKAGAEMGRINIFGIQDESGQENDIWNDWLGINIDSDVWVWKGTTNPGRKTQEKASGAGHMAYGFHNKIWCIDIHAPSIKNWAHEALCQRPAHGCGAIKYWRDVNKHFIFDPETDKIESSKECYMNFHRASKAQDVTTIGTYSEGCQVTLHAADLEEVLEKIKAVDEVAVDPKGYLFSYLLTNISEWSNFSI